MSGLATSWFRHAKSASINQCDHTFLVRGYIIHYRSNDIVHYEGKLEEFLKISKG